ncbi:MAG: TolC family protein [bacterium]|nr:TolC family protein [bacterium]
MSRIRSGRIRLLAAMILTVVAAAPVALAQESNDFDPNLPVLTLSDCVEVALGTSPTLLIADERRMIADQNVTEAFWAFAPSLSLSRTWNKSERKDFDVAQSEVFMYQTVDSNLDTTDWIGQRSNPENLADATVNTKFKDWGGAARLNIFSGFSKFSNLGSARSSLRAAEATRVYTREQIVQNVVVAYYNLLRSAELLEVAVETRDQVAKELEKTETYFRLGSAAKSDVLQQRVQLENRRLDVVRADNTVKMRFADLAHAMNRPLASTFRVDRSLLDMDFAVEPVDALFAEALANRLDLRSSELTVRARHKDVTTATASAWPSVDLFANYSRYQNDSPYRFGSQESESISWGYQINWNVFDRLQTWTGRSRAKASARIAEYEHDQAKLNIQVEVRQLYNLAVEARELARVSAETIIQSEEELRLAQERFRVGAGTTLDVIVARANVSNARGQEVQAKCDFLVAQAQLDRAVGRLSTWTRDAR